MKVLQINSVCGVGSTGRIATNISRILKSKGHESYIAYGRGTAQEELNTIRIGTKLDNYTHVAETRLLDLHGFGSKSATKQFIQKVKEINPDIIHLHNLHGYYINIEILFKYLKESNKKVVWTLHDCWAFTGHCVHFEYIKCNKWKTNCQSCPQKKEYPVSLFLDNSEKNFFNKKELFTGLNNLTIVTPSKWLTNLVKQSFLGIYPIKTINNGIDLDVFKPTKSNFREKYNIGKSFIVLGVARWDKRKGLDYLIQLSKHLNNDYQVVVVGLTENQKSMLPENIIGITQTNNIEKLVEIYSAANVFVNPTFEDNFPTTNLEALACGIPVITFDTGGSAESIDENTGFVIEQGNFEQLMNIVIKLKKTDLDYKENCINRVKEEFLSENKYLEYIKLYENLTC
ncbi:glycosyltransferase [Psychrobacillus sp. NPDC093180]|uniref:glycosyltransferase n=1 Tax=Psychrobacillus sp. NPDC093180 TaxID=3364489 RepID=UPI0037F3010A